MHLDEKDRLIIANQLKILEKLYPEEAEYYAHHRKAVEEGYSLHYSWLVEHFYDEMSEDECKEVLDILDMFRAITFSLNKLNDTSRLDVPRLKFRGFDGNHETRQFSYTQYFISDLGRYEELKYGAESGYFNSHAPMIDAYREMLKRWRDNGKSFEMSKSELAALIES
jgi:hypothetical protein